MPPRNNGDDQQPVILRPDDNENETLTLVVGFRNYINLERLKDGLAAHRRRCAAGDAAGRPWHIVGAQQHAQRVFDDAVNHQADLVVLNPLLEGYRHGLISDLLLNTQKPIPVIGMVKDRSDMGREMISNGAAGKIRLPIDEASVAAFLGKAEEAVNQAWRDRAAGRVQYTTNEMAGADDLSYERKTIAVWLPKGGGSTRTTIAVNLAVAFSHVELGKQSTILLDLDMSKGDCHTLLGFTTDPAEAKRYDIRLLNHDLYTLVARTKSAYEHQGARVINALQVNPALVAWEPKQSRLALLPGLTNAANAGSPEMREMDLLYNIACQIIETVQRRATFVVIDLGQDFTRPFHRAALEVADQVLVPVPPIRSAILDTRHALRVFQEAGQLDKFSLVITAYDAAFGWSAQQIIQALEPLTRVGPNIPFDAQTANLAVNQGMPVVCMSPQSTLAQALLDLAGVFYPPLSKSTRKTSWIERLKQSTNRIMFRGA